MGWRSILLVLSWDQCCQMDICPTKDTENRQKTQKKWVDMESEDNCVLNQHYPRVPPVTTTTLLLTSNKSWACILSVYVCSKLKDSGRLYFFFSRASLKGRMGMTTMLSGVGIDCQIRKSKNAVSKTMQQNPPVYCCGFCSFNVTSAFESH
jgi:hypothetical protein